MAWNDSEYERSWRKQSEKHRRGNVRRAVLAEEITLAPMGPTITPEPIPLDVMAEWDREESEWIRAVGDDF